MSRKAKWLNCFVPHRLEMLLSPAWQAAPRPLLKILERIEIEHLRHGTVNNGELYVSYGQFVDYGISRRTIRPAQQLGVALGFLEVQQAHDGLAPDIRAPNRYRLTYLPAKGKAAPTDDWRTVKPERAKALVEQFRADERVAEKATGRAA